uniref:immunoglobulin superfamily member 8 n=1 Tax=Centroberyx gerrardi TaxID=166262 RepID=UPI003AADA4F3
MMMMASLKTAGFVFLQWALQYALCRDVTLPPGPVYRVAGFPISLPCAVSGYEGPRTQEFEWFLYREDAGGRQMGVVSTRDQGFPYAPFQARVRAGEVRVERDSGDKARLVIQRLRPEDQGKYECYTPSTDSTYQGNYSASIAIKVIPDTLQISYSRALSGQPVPEGAELTLTCSAGVQSKQHTHLSITFGKRGGESSESGAGGEVSTVGEIISIDRVLGVTPGSSGSYKKRYDDGEITLEKRNGEGGRDVYVMKMSAVQAEDTGSYFCEASQWILDPDGSWQKIAQRILDIGNLTVQKLAESVSVTSSPRGEVTVQAGAPLSLTCEVSGLSSAGKSGLLVQWMKRGSASSDLVGTRGVEVEVARITPDGVVSWGDDLSRASGGSMEKVAEGRYSLKLFSARPSDSGVYRCAVSVYAGRSNPGPSTAATFTQRSEGVTVNLKTNEVLVSAVAELARGPQLKRGSTITLICNVTVTTASPAQLQVQWLQRPIPEPVITKGEKPPSELPPPRPPVEGKPRLVAALTYEGVAQIYGSGSEVSIDRLAADSYRLRVHSATLRDQGLYVCQAEVWWQDPHGGWYPTGVKTESSAVTVPLYSQVLVSAVAELPRGPLLKRGSTITLICNVTVTNTSPTQLQVQWLQRPIPEPVITKGEKPPSELPPPSPPVEEKPRLVAALTYEGVAQIYANGSEISIDRLAADSYRLRVHSATLRDQGLYVCQAEVWWQNPHGGWTNTGAKAESSAVTVYLYARAADLLLIPLVIGVSSALFVGIVIIATVTCCFMKRLARQRGQK